jgi:membrane-associated protein
MGIFHDLLAFIRDPGSMFATIGLVGIAGVVFVEAGLLFPFLPGDSLLVVAGIYAARGILDLPLLMALLVPAAILGGAIGYLIGYKAGPRLFRPRPDAGTLARTLLKPEYAAAAHRFFDRHGGKALVIARFMPIVRTYVPVVAGVGKMPFGRYMLWNALGALLWIVSLCMAGFFLGEIAERAGFSLQQHLEKVIIVVVFLSILPGLIAWWRGRKGAKA